MEQKTELKVYLIEYKCPNCVGGKMESYHTNTYSNGHKSYSECHHKCNNCGYLLKLHKQYPYKEYIKDNRLNSIENMYESDCKCGCNK